MAAEKGMNRSCYGVQEYSPEAIKEQWREFMRVLYTFTTYFRECVKKCNLAYYKLDVQKKRTNAEDSSKSLTYFNNNKKNDTKSTYDRTFHIQHGYCSRIHRDDREHTQGLDVHAEEQSKAVPILSSSVYGHRPPLEVPSRQHVRVGQVKRDFYRHCGATIPNEESVLKVQARK
ncbi:uncharacterized protein C5orf49 homolog [Dendronephthya gigantea]|uniref:uncharacterized protein C5orf49 homolog n=1 Tax=Dendronephthya gigantea TaxID=151771 RepID=UPI00106A9686|nr:uncharacterized protein C5orf49 homolog [Dendronephthya gigantea]